MSKRCRHISVRLNPDDPKHVHIIDVLDDLNLDVHKSKNRFLVNALVYYINSMESGTLTYHTFHYHFRKCETFKNGEQTAFGYPFQG